MASAALLAALVIVGGAVAFTTYLNLGGSSNGTFTSNVQNLGALTVSQNGTAPALDAGGSIDDPVKIQNVDPANVSHSITSTPTVTFTSNTTGCATHLSVTGYKDSNGSAVLLNGQSFTAGQTKQFSVVIAADATTPATCAGATWQATYSATTN